MVEVEDGQHGVVGLFGELDQQLDDALEELARLRLAAVLGQRQQIYNKPGRRFHLIKIKLASWKYSPEQKKNNKNSSLDQTHSIAMITR